MIENLFFFSFYFRISNRDSIRIRKKGTAIYIDYFVNEVS